MCAIIRILFIQTILSLFGEVMCNGSTQKPPTILVGILIRNKAHTLPYFLSLLQRLDYPKDRMTLCIRSDNNIDGTPEILRVWLNAESDKYHAVDVIIDDESLPESNQEKDIAVWSLDRFRRVIDLREGILEIGRKIWADYIFMLDADVFLTNPGTLSRLVSKNKTVVAPLVKSDGMYSNFWAGMTRDYYYVRTERYEPILNREEIGCFEVPMVHTVLLIDMNKEESDSLTYNSKNLANYDGPTDDVITFALSGKMSGVPLHVCNDEIYGYAMVPLESGDSFPTDVQHLTNLKLDILARQRALPLSESMKKFVQYPEKDALGFDKIYMINLRRRPERRDRMARCFDELGIVAETIDAVDGRSIDEASLKEWGVRMIPEYMDPYHNRSMTMGEIGCFLSHYIVWKKIAENDYERAMILEDDVRFEPFFRQKMTSIIHELDSLRIYWDLVYLGRKRLESEEERLVDDSEYLVYPSYSYWTIGYMLSQSGAKKLLRGQPLDNMIPVDEYLPILFDRHPRDAWKKYFPTRDLVALSVNPLVVYPTHYTGETGYVSDTEDSKVVSTGDVGRQILASRNQEL